MVIVILAILGTLAGPRFFDNDAFSERAYADELTAALRYAQKVAIASGCQVRVDVSAATYAVRQQAALSGHCDVSDASFPLPVLLSTGETLDGVAPANVSTAPALTFSFDALGRTDLGADQTFTVGSRLLTVEAGSGLVLSP